MHKAVKSLFAFTLGFGACVSHGALVINEVCYDNASVADETGDTTSDWIELYNSGPDDVHMAGYGLGDANPYRESSGVRLPDYTLSPGGYLVVFASGDRPEYTAWVNAPGRAVIAPNAQWRYRSAQGAPVSAWKDPAFDDASWPTGIAPFGYNDVKQNMDCATVLDYGTDPDNRYPAAYFRTSFTAINPAVTTGLVIRARIDDGMVVYLNGREVLRQNMPEGPVSHATLALSSVPSTRWTTVSLGTNGLLRGVNALAVEVHQALGASPDLIMDMTLTELVSGRVPVVHGQFKLANGGENIHLFNAGLTRVQVFAPPGREIGQDRSYGASPDGSTSAYYVCDRPTPGAANAVSITRYIPTEALQKPVFSPSPGVYETAQTVALMAPAGGYRICYSLDGTDPRESDTFVTSGGGVALRAAGPATNGLSWIRTNPGEMDNAVAAAAWCPPLGGVGKVAVLRAVTVSPDGKRCSPETCGSYLIGTPFTNRALPVVSLITDPENLFGFVSGIYVPGKSYADSPEGYGGDKWGKPYANYFQSGSGQEWERPVHVELFEAAKSGPAVSLTLGAALYGGNTRAFAQKSLKLLARQAEYGSDQVDYALFPQVSSGSYKRVLLSNSGDDWYGPDSAGVATMLRDGVFHELAKTLNFAVMAYRPAIVYIGGEYWGIHNLRESFDKYYFAGHYGLDPDTVDLLQQTGDSGDAKTAVIASAAGDGNAGDDYRSLLAWVQANALDGDANFRQFQTHADVTNYTDCVIAETFFASSDWPANDGLLWRAHTNQTAVGGAGDTRWRWALGNLDRAGERGSDVDMFATLSDEAKRSTDNPRFLINELWKNAEYCRYFVARYERLLNTVFRPEGTSAHLEKAADVIAPEIEAHFRRWGRSTTQAQWRQAVNATLSQFAAERQAVTWGQLDAKFSLGGSWVLEVRNVRTDGVGGHFVVDGLVIEPATPGVVSRAQWSGRFFKGRAIAVQAVPDAGYVFDGWEGRAETKATLSAMATDAPQVFEARFLPVNATRYTVTFDAEGGAVSPTSGVVTAGGPYGALPVPTRTGYVFAGWWTDAQGTGVQVTANSVVAGETNLALYAKWAKAPSSGRVVTAGVACEMPLPDAFTHAVRVTVSGLPPGLKYDSRTRAIMGIPAKHGEFNISVAAAGVPAQTFTVTVAPLPPWAQGVFNGYLTSDAGGLASMSVTALGRASGKLALGGVSYMFSSASYVQDSEHADGLLIETEAKSGARALPLTLRVSGSVADSGGTGRVAEVLSTVGGILGGTDGFPLVMYRNVWSDAGLGPYVGYYTAALPGGAAYGSGYLAFTVNAAGGVKTAGKLADGTAVSLSGSMIVDEAGRLFAALYAAPAAYKGGSFFGLAEFVRPDSGRVIVHEPDSGPFLWTSGDPQATGVHGSGFVRTVGLAGGWYDTSGNLYGYYRDKDLTVGAPSNSPLPEITSGTNRHASVWWNPNGVALTVVTNRAGEMTGITAPKAGVPTDPEGDYVWDYSAGNTVGLKLGLTRATGVFKGSFTAWFDYGTRHTGKSVAYEGILTPERENKADGVEGRGFFLWADRARYLNPQGQPVSFPFNVSYDFLLSTE